MRRRIHVCHMRRRIHTCRTIESMHILASHICDLASHICLHRIYVRAARTSPERNRVCSAEGKHRTAANNPNLALMQLSPHLKRVWHTIDSSS